jgi:hypothetical protein
MEPLFATSTNCRHGCCRVCLNGFLVTKLDTGPFPVRCPVCSSSNHLPADRGLMTRTLFKALASVQPEAVIDVLTAQRLLVQQVLHLPDEPSIDLMQRMSKPCPQCNTKVAHYRRHGCHHIKPGTGCPSCHVHFCYVCLLPYAAGGGKQCSCPLFCNDACGCAPCPECAPGASCSICDGCPVCH